MQRGRTGPQRRTDMLSTDNRTSGTTTQSRHMAALTRHAASSTAASLDEISRVTRRVWAGAVARRATPFDLAAQGALWWSTMTDRRVPEWHLPRRTVLSTPFAHVHDFSPAGADT